jgi:hypothetical protein
MRRIALCAISALALTAGAAWAADAPSDRVSLEKMIGHAVKSDDGKKIGDIEDIVLDKSGQARQAVIDLDWSTSDIAVDMSRLHADPKDKDDMVLSGVSKADIDAMPAYKYDKDTVSLKHK